MSQHAAARPFLSIKSVDRSDSNSVKKSKVGVWIWPLQFSVDAGEALSNKSD